MFSTRITFRPLARSLRLTPSTPNQPYKSLQRLSYPVPRTTAFDGTLFLHSSAVPSYRRSHSRREDARPPSSPDGVTFDSLACTLLRPERGPLDNHLHPIAIDVLTSFLPRNQPLAVTTRTTARSSRSASISSTSFIRVTSDDGADTGLIGPGGEASEESVLALASPFDGGEIYIRQAVEQIAGYLDAEVLRVNLAFALGFDGPTSPLGACDPLSSAPRIDSGSNPILSDCDSQPSSHSRDGNQDDGEGEGANAVLRIPIITLSSMPTKSSAYQEGVGGPQSNWVSFFEGLLAREGEKDRLIVLLEASSTMAASFSIWWPSLLHAVRNRRQTPSSGGTGRRRSQPSSAALTKPTTIVISCAPSLLTTHTVQDPVDAADKSTGVTASGFGPGKRQIGDAEEVPLWWSAAEDGDATRTVLERRRLAALKSGNLSAAGLLPAFQNTPNTDGEATDPILAALSAHVRPTQSSPVDSVKVRPIPILPSLRDVAAEKEFCRSQRLALSAALLSRAVALQGGYMSETLDVLLQRSSTESAWEKTGIDWLHAQSLAAQAIGDAALAAMADGNSDLAPPIITWASLEAAQKSRVTQLARMQATLDRYLPSAAFEQHTLDAVVEDLRQSHSLSAHEKRLLPCIVDSSKLAATTFDDVHLSHRTIDGIRTLVSLPLLYPEAFKGGVLKDHSTTGALLFGPPGTGKTLLARAVARESGARMLAIQPSDVNDMYVGEGEKMVKAVFSMARRLSPCVIFVDEVDALFGARSAKDAFGGGKAHNQILTEFMQEMDGLTSAGLNRDKRIVLIGATNRPFDLDDAILRRLPRRLLVDLPRVRDREAILGILLRHERLASDVDLVLLAEDTDGFSGSDLKHLCVSAALAAVKDTVKLPWQLADQKPASSGAAEVVGDGNLPGREGIAVGSAAFKWEGKKARFANTSGGLALSQLGANARRHTSSSAHDSDLDHPRPGRTISRRHFDIALSEIRPSSSEEGTLPELRKWAELYGEGGTKRAKKSGFGKAFGFGAGEVTGGPGYGRVSQN